MHYKDHHFQMWFRVRIITDVYSNPKPSHRLCTQGMVWIVQLNVLLHCEMALGVMLLHVLLETSNVCVCVFLLSSLFFTAIAFFKASMYMQCVCLVVYSVVVCVQFS